MEKRRSISMYELNPFQEAISTTPQVTESEVTRTGTLNGFLRPLALGDQCRIVWDKLKQLQHENNQLLSLTAEQTEDVQQTRTWLKNTKMLLAGKERSRLLAIEQCNQVREATREIERCARNERAERLNAEEELRESRLQKERIGIEILEEMSFQHHLRARLETLEATLKHFEWDVDIERKNQEELNEVLASRRQEEKEIKSCSHNLDIEKIQLKAEEITHSSLCFQNKARQELEKSSLREIDELEQTIAERKNQMSNLQDDNAGFTSSIQGQRAKVGLVQRLRHWLRRLNCMRPNDD